MNAPKPKSVNMRDLKKKMGQEHDSTKDKVKDIEFRIPTSPKEANPDLLIRQAETLMEEQGIPSFFVDEFRREATTMVGVFHVVATIRKWFTLVVPTTTWAPLPDDTSIPTLWETEVTE